MASGRELAHAELIGALLIAGFGTLISLFPFHSWAAPRIRIRSRSGSDDACRSA